MLQDLGEEFVEYLEKELNVDEAAAQRGSSASGQQTQSSRASTSTNSAGSTSSSRESSSSSSSSRGSGSGSAGKRGSEASSGYRSSEDYKYQGWAEELEKKGKEIADDVEEQLQKLKREMGL